MSKFASYYNSTSHFFTIHLILIFGCSDKTWQSKSDVVNSIFLNLEYNNYDSIQIMQYFDSIQKQINIKNTDLEIFLHTQNIKYKNPHNKSSNKSNPSIINCKTKITKVGNRFHRASGCK